MSTVTINPMAGLSERCDYPGVTPEVLPGRAGAPVVRVGPVRLVFADREEARSFLHAFGRAMAIALEQPEGDVVPMPTGRRRRVTPLHSVGSRRPDGAA